MTVWLGALPLTGDAVEGISQHELLARLLEARDPRLLGPVRVICMGAWVHRELGAWGAGTLAR